MFSCNLRCLLIFLHGRSRAYLVASLRAGPVGRISYNLYFDCKHVRYVTCDFNKRKLILVGIKLELNLQLRNFPSPACPSLEVRVESESACLESSLSQNVWNSSPSPTRLESDSSPSPRT